MRYFWQKTFGDVAPYLYDKQNIVEPVMEFVQMKELSDKFASWLIRFAFL